jgi:nucleoside-diphosphate-sugar epimerase
MSEVLITGGAGAIGSNVAARLVERGELVTILDDLSSGFRENVSETARFVYGSITNVELLDQLFRESRFELVVHCAALFANQNSVEHPERDLEVNALGTLNLAKRASAHARRGVLRRFIYLSSSCVYGNCSGGVTEDTAIDTSTPYAISKLMGEHYCLYFAKSEALPVTMFRLFNVYGPGERPGRYRNVIPNFVDSALRGEPLLITGTGAETRDFMYVGDLVDGLLAAAACERACGEVYNMATGAETRIDEMAHQIVLRCGSRSEIRRAPRRAWDHTIRRVGDASKAAAHFGFHPGTPLETGLAHTVEWLRRSR